MYFKSIELYGFKSFAGRTKIDFEPGITAIVGPNGCGKSNIVDGIKWVLGEQSAKDLRGLNMEDVIFNGTDTKDPVGFADVSLTLSNESKFLPIEYEEVVITRRLFRSGDSEYLLNKNQVRLKDILELFMGTGVGTSSYSIVEQGKIDMIISSKPEDRRYIFEEASGIIKYKSKKKEAIRKLEYTENNLLRVSDIIEEVKRQISSIERQARKAERYKEEFEKLKTLDTKVAFLEFKDLNADKETITKDLSDLKNNDSILLRESADLSAAITDLKVKLIDIENKLSEVQFKELNLNSNIDRSTDKIKLDEERYKELESLKQSLLNEQNISQKAISELEETVANLTKEIEGISTNKAQKEDLLNQKEEQFRKLEEEFKENEQNIKNGKIKIVDILSLHSKIKNDLTKLSSDLSNFQARERRLKVEEEDVKKELAIIKQTFNQIDTEANSLEKKINENRTIKINLESELTQKNAQLTGTRNKIEELKSRKLSLVARLTLLQDMVRRYEGFRGGSKAILVEKQQNQLNIPGVYGAVAELINVKKGYEIAVEQAIGERLECIVVENRKAALDLVNYLKAKNLGKATIVSLDSIKNLSKDNPDLIAEQGIILGKLSDYVETEKRFKDLVAILFCDVYLVKDLDTLVNIKPTYNKTGAKFVTVSGDIFENGFLTSGSIKDDTDVGILNRKKEIKEIEDELGRVRQNMMDLETLQNSLTKETSEFLERINVQTELIRQDELVLANKKSQRENIAASLKKINDELSLLNLEKDELTDEINSLKTRQVSYETELKLLDEENNAIQNLITQAQAFIDKAIKEKESLLVDITKIKTELSGVLEYEKNLLANLKMQEGLLNNQNLVLDERKKNHNEANLKQEELKNEINILQVRVQDSTKEKGAVLVEFQGIKNKKSELEGLIRQKEDEFKNEENELNGIKDKLHNLQMRLQENSFKLETLKTRIAQAYKVDIGQFSPDIEQEFDLEATKNIILELQQKIEKMGPVNLVAIEEHQELKERFDFLTKQKEDLTNAKDSLLEAIRKINKTTRELFMDTFQKVRLEFKEYFRFLFGGGQAELVLMDEQDVLECGIEIMARPPGKKLQSISLLSGGEKALCAIALLFSIFKVKPSPFCILDEVDAPLDESNIGKFTKLLSEFTKSSQFIIVTHNKKTISMSDVMYGITMEQNGVSKVVSVKFAKSEVAPAVHS